MRHLFCLLLMFAVVPVAGAIEVKSPGPEWTEANRKDSFVIFTKDDKAAGVRAIVAITEVDAPPATVFEVVGDFDHYAEYMPYVKNSRVVEKKDGVLVVYSLLSPPLVDNRDYYIEVRRTHGDQNGGVFKSAWTSVPDYKPEADGVIRVKLNTGSWVIEPLDGGKRSRVTYNLLTHPGGSIPRWLANKSNTVAIPDLFEAVSKRAAKIRKPDAR